MVKFIHLIVLLLLATSAAADKARYLEIAERGWNYTLRSTMVGRDMTIPVRINGRSLAGAAICIVGERPHRMTWDVLHQFRRLAEATYKKTLPMRFAGPSIHGCGIGRTVVLRLFSDAPPHDALATDTHWLNAAYALGLSERQIMIAQSPAMGQTFFGRSGQATHIMIQQPNSEIPSVLEGKFFKSILIEELFQTFTFGMDIAHFNKNADYLSKLQEWPFAQQTGSWTSPEFMRAILGSNPVGLCEFDVFMLHAVASSPAPTTNSSAFIDYIEEAFADLHARTQVTMNDPLIEPLLDRNCRPVEYD